MPDLLIENVRLIDPASELDQPGACSSATAGSPISAPGSAVPDGVGASTAAARSSARAWSTCAPPSASPATNTAKPSPAPPRPPSPAASPPSPPCPTAAPPSTTRRSSASCAAAARKPARITVLPYAAITRGCRGEELAEIGLLREAGAVAFTDGQRAIGDARLMRLALSYARGFGALHHPAPGGPGAGRRRRRHRGRAGHAPRPARHPGRGRGDPGRPRHPPGQADRRPAAFRPCLHRARRWS